MSERQAGLYWVKAYEDGISEGLHWHGKWWAGCSIGYEPPVVGPRLPAPTEPWQLVPALDGDEQQSLARFVETTRDDGTYEIGKAMIGQLARKGAIRHLSAGHYELTETGQAMLATTPGPS